MIINRTVHKNRQSGQSMVEYTVILIALTAAMLTVTSSEYGHVGTRKSLPGDENYQKYDRSLMQAVHQRYQAQSFGLRISELPERNINELSQYYNRLEKFPTLSSEIETVSSNLKKLNQSLNDVNDGISTLNNLKESASDGLQEVKEKVTSTLDVFKG